MTSSSELPPLLIHIGYHKTGSTWLQTGFFRNKQYGFSTVDGEGPKKFAAKMIYGGRTGLLSPLEYNPAAVRENYENSVRGSSNPTVISHEDFVSHVYNGGIFIKQNALNLKRTFPEAKILIVVRRQQDLVRSAYSDFLEDGGVCSIRKFLSRYNENQVPLFTPQYLSYDKTILLYRKLFSPDSVLVLPYELLRADPLKFLRLVLDHAGARCKEQYLEHLCAEVKNRSNKKRFSFLSNIPWINLLGEATNNNGRGAMGLARTRSRIVHYGSKMLTERYAERREKKIQEYIEWHFRDHFVQANQRLARMVSWNPSDYGYDM